MSEYHDPANVVNPEHSDHHIVTPIQYGMVFAALLAGTILTVVAAKIDLGFSIQSSPWGSLVPRR